MRDDDGAPLGTALGFAIAVVILSLYGCPPGNSQDFNGLRGHGHAEHHDWYKDLTQPDTGYSCCNAVTAEGEGDCRPGSVWRDSDGTVWARLNGQSVAVPPNKVLPDSKNLKPITGHICEKNGNFYYALVGGAGG